MRSNHNREVTRFIGLGLVELTNKGYGLFLALLIPLKFGLEDYGRIQFLIFTLTSLAALVSGNARTLLMRRSPKFRNPEYVMKYFVSISILSTIALFFIYLFLYIAHYSVTGVELDVLVIYENSGFLHLALYICWVEAILVMSISGGVFISLSLAPALSLINLMRILGLIVSMEVSSEPSSLISKLAIIELIACIISLFYLFWKSGTRKLEINFSMIFRIFKMKASLFLNLGNFMTLVGLWLFQYVLSLGENGLIILGLYGLLNRYLSIVTTLPGLLFQKQLAYFEGSMSELSNRRSLLIQALSLFVYSAFGSLVCMIFLPDNLLQTSGMSVFPFSIVIQTTCFCLLLNGLLGTRALQLGGYRALGRSDLGLGLLMSLISFSLFIRPFGFGVAMTLFSLSYLFSCLILLREIRS